MKKDIDLLGGFNEAKNKKSSSNATLLLVVGVVLIIGVMIFLFVSAKMEIKDKEALVADLDRQLQDEARINIMQQQIESDKAKYKSVVSEVVKEVYSGEANFNVGEISSKFLEILYDNYTSQLDEKGDVKVKIGSLTIDQHRVSISCETKSYREAWDFVYYLRGTLELPRPAIGSSPEVMAAYEKRQAEIRKNADYFSGVTESYPGLPEEGTGEDYDISFALSFEINWGAMAES